MFLACGAPPPKPVPVAPPEPQPESVEWLHATPRSSGVIADECKIVDKALEAEKGCSGSLCKYAVNLGKDWLHVCPRFDRARRPDVQQRVTDFESRTQQGKKQCELRAERMLVSECRASSDCAELAQTWATQCGAQFGTPLVLTIIEREVQRVTGKSVRLDPTSCDQEFDKVAEPPTCGDDFDCGARLEALERFRAKCEPAGTRVSAARAIRVGRLLVSARRAPPPIDLSDSKLGPEIGAVLLADGSGAVLTAAGKRVDSLPAFVQALKESEYLDPVVVAKVFTDGPQVQLRFGTVFAAEASDYFRRLLPLALSGQAELKRNLAKAAVADALARAVERSTQSPPDERAALAELVKAAAAARALDRDADAQSGFTSVDAKLAGVCEWYGQEKSRAIAKVSDKALRHAATLRNDRWLFADVDDKGGVGPDRGSDAVFFDSAWLPECAHRYREKILHWVRTADKTKLSEKDAAALAQRVRTGGDACIEQKTALVRKEKALIACAFGLEACDEARLDAVTAELDAAVGAVERTRTSFQAMLGEVAAADRSAYDAVAGRCFE
jgi:hypothetical protein